MKKRSMECYGKKAGSVLLAALVTVSGLASATSFAVCAEEAETEIETEAETEAAEVTELELDVDGETVVVTNESGLYIESIAFGEAALTASDENGAEAETETEDAEAETEAAAEEAAAEVLLVTETNGTVHTFEDASVDGLSNLKLTSKIGYVFVVGTDSSGDEKYFYETAEDVVLDEPVVMYTTGMVNIREEADGSSTLLGTAARGSEVEVLGGTSKWFQVTQDDVTGYVAARYLTESSEEAQEAVDQEATARAQLEAQAAAAAAAAAAASSSSSGSDVVSREAVYDCDGSGHGYYIVTHSDGSVTYEDF